LAFFSTHQAIHRFRSTPPHPLKAGLKHLFNILALKKIPIDIFKYISAGKLGVKQFKAFKKRRKCVYQA